MANIRDIARHSGTSVSTVSRAMNNSGYVSQETRERIEEAVRALNYRPNAGAQVLRSGRSKMIGVLVPSLRQPYFAELAEEIERKLFARGYHAMICPIDQDLIHATAYIDMLYAKQVDGLIVATGAKDEGLLARLGTTSIPVIALDKRLGIDNTVFVGGDNHAGGRIAMEHLISLGHRKTAILALPSKVSTVCERTKGASQACLDAGVPLPDIHMDAGYSADLAEKVARDVLQSNDRPTAIFATCDTAAIGAIRAAQSLGLDVPGDISIIGYDDIPAATYTSPQLTTISQPTSDIAGQAVRMLFERPGDADRRAGVLLPVSLVVRASTAAPR